MVVVLLLLAVLLATAAAHSSPPASNGAGPEPTLTFCSGHSPAATSSEVTSRFLAAVCAGAYGGAHMSSSHVVAGNRRTMCGVAQCRRDLPVSDCAACLAAASKLIISAGTASAVAVWLDACFLRYSERGPRRFRDGECTATVFNASGAPHEGAARAVVRRLLLAATGDSAARCGGGVGAGTATGTTAAGGGRKIYGLTRCAAGVSCADCRRCLRGAVAVVEREYNGSVGMQVLRHSCMARYESYPFYNNTNPLVARRRLLAAASASGFDVVGGSNITVSGPGDTSPPVPAPPGGHNPPPSPPAQARAPPPSKFISYPYPDPFPTGAAQPTPAPPGDHNHTLQPVVTTLNSFKWLIVSVATGLTIAAITLALTIWCCRKRRLAQRGHVIEPIVLKCQADVRPEAEETVHDQENKHLSKDEGEEEDGGTTSCQVYSYQVLEAATCCFSSRNKLGSGGFGTVYKGTLENGKEVAVKKLRDSKRTIQELEREISIVVNLRHDNLLRFLGCCFQEEGRFLIYEYMPNNSLDKFWYKVTCMHTGVYILVT